VPWYEDEDEDEDEDEEEDEEDDDRPTSHPSSRRRRHASRSRHAASKPRHARRRAGKKPLTPGGKQLVKAGLTLLAETDLGEGRVRWYEVEDHDGERWTIFRSTPQLWLAFGHSRGDYGYAKSAEEIAERRRHHGFDSLGKDRKKVRNVVLKAPLELAKESRGLCVAVLEELAAQREERGGGRGKKKTKSVKRKARR
jgi:hypothetical protein